MAQRRKTQEHEEDALTTLVAELKEAHNLGIDGMGSGHYEDGIADIITFCDDPSLLNLPGNGVKLYPAQRIVLKALYMGTRGNKDLKLTTEEWDWLISHQHLNETVTKFIEKLRFREQHKDDNNSRFSDLHLVLGRRSGKTTVASIISVYEAYKLMVINNGNPSDYYQLPSGSEISILNVATSEAQSMKLFNEISLRISQSVFFQGKIDKTLETSIRLFTGADLRNKQNNKGNIAIKGSVLVQCGHSNPKSLRGSAAICIIFDELAFYDESKVVSGKEFYEALRPSISQFSRYGDGIAVTISSPGPRNGIFYKLWHNSFVSDMVLALRMPTWIFNPMISFDDSDLVQARLRDPAKFKVEYGGEWPESGMTGRWFAEDLIDRAIKLGETIGLMPEEYARPNYDYFIHIDPASKQDNYALVVIYKGTYRNGEGLWCPRIFLSKVKVWPPMPGIGLDYLAIEREIVEICQRFRPVSVSFDTWQSDAAVANLRRAGFMAHVLSFNGRQKQKYYQNLRELMLKPEGGLWLYNDPQLIPELRNLSWRQTSGRFVDIGADKKNEDISSDDCSDALAGAAFLASQNYYRSGLFITSAYTPNFR